MYIVSFYVKIRILADKMLSFLFEPVNWPVEWRAGAGCGFPWTNTRFPLEEHPVSLGGTLFFSALVSGQAEMSVHVSGYMVLPF